jgi:hypothetical protein
MSKNRKRSFLNEAKTSREYRILWLEENYPPYWDDGLNLYPAWRRGFKNSGKAIESYKMRMYRTWKHNRKTQWK